MLNIFKKLFGKSAPPVVAAAPRVVARPAAPKAPAEPVSTMPQVEVAHLSLAAIIQKLPEDLKNSVAQFPDASITVALPLATIQKQLPTGSVKMSLASLYRQAPAGTFAQTRTEDRRMVEVPLSEVFRHVSPNLLPRREQRRVDLPQDAVGLFGDTENPYALAPGVREDAPQVAAASAPKAQQRVIQPPTEMRAQVPARPAAAAPAPATQAQPRVVRQPTATPRSTTPPTGFHSPSQAAPSNEPPLLLSISDLAGGWPEPIRSEALALDGAQVALPSGPVTAGLARGKVAFTWGQIRSWTNPPPSTPTEAREATELILPLKVVAPAFLAHSKPKAQRRTYDLDDSIPALFSGGQAAAPAPAETPAIPAPEPEPVPAPAPVLPAPVIEPEPALEAPADVQAHAALPETDPVPPTPTVIAPPADFRTEVAAPESTPEVAPEPVQAHIAEPIPEPVEEPTPASPALVTPARPGARSKQSLGDLLGDPEKSHWSPPELVKAAAAMPGVAGAVVGLQEGLLVAAQLPEHMKGDTVAAFLPQIFARLTNYAGEMKLGGVEDILFTTNGAHFQIYRLGEVYFAVLSKPGESLPWEGLRLIVEELAHQHQK